MASLNCPRSIGARPFAIKSAYYDPSRCIRVPIQLGNGDFTPASLSNFYGYIYCYT